MLTYLNELLRVAMARTQELEQDESGQGGIYIGGGALLIIIVIILLIALS